MLKKRDNYKNRLSLRLLPFLGPTFIAAIGYIDPGNFATNIAAGSHFSYTLLWVVLWSNIAAALIQALSAKLGFVTGKNLAEIIAQKVSSPFRYFYWIQAELIAIATDIAEILGGAIGFQLIFGGSLLEGAILTGALTIIILTVQRHGFRPLEVIIGFMLLTVCALFIIELRYSSVDWAKVAYHTSVPHIPTHSLYFIAGIIGATIMPHVIYLHSSLTQNRYKAKTEKELRHIHKTTIIDVIIAMSIAGFVNLAILILSAAVFHSQSFTVEDLSTAYHLLTPLVGRYASIILGCALILSGVSSSIVGTMAGQVLMQSFVNFKISIWVRRSVTLIPAFLVIIFQLNPQTILILSQVVLSFGIPLAIIPLVLCTQNSKIMGNFVNHWVVSSITWLITAGVIFINLYLLIKLF